MVIVDVLADALVDVRKAQDALNMTEMVKDGREQFVHDTDKNIRQAYQHLSNSVQAIQKAIDAVAKLDAVLEEATADLKKLGAR